MIKARTLVNASLGSAVRIGRVLRLATIEPDDWQK